MPEATSKLELEVGTVGVIELDAAPVTKLTPTTAKSVLVDKDETTIPINGTQANLPAAVPLPAQLTWKVSYANGRSLEHAVPGFVKLGGSRFDFTIAKDPTGPVASPMLRAFEHRLLGEGKVGATLKVGYPHCPEVSWGAVAHFNNQAEVRVGGWRLWNSGQADEVRLFDKRLDDLASASGVPVGEPYVLSLATTGVARLYLEDKGVFRLVMSELARNERGALAPLAGGYREELRWPKWRGQGAPNDGTSATPPPLLHVWLAACTAGSTPKGATLVYALPGASGEIELGYTLSVLEDAVDEKKGIPFVELVSNRPFMKLRRLELSAFSLRPVTAGGPLSFVASGAVSGVHEELPVLVEVQLWRRVERTVGGKAVDVVESACDATVVTATGGRFEASFTPAAPAAAKAFWAAMRLLPDKDADREPKLPLSTILDWDAKTYPPFTTQKGGGGVYCDLAKARWVCSAEVPFKTPAL